MTDLIQPFAQIFQEEAMSFWSFESFMKTARENFMTDESGIMTRIGLIKLVLGEVSKELFERLNDIGAGSFFFAYRMILVFLRRELNVEDSILFWEVLWVEDLLEQQEEGKDEAHRRRDARAPSKFPLRAYFRAGPSAERGAATRPSWPSSA